MTTAHVWNLEPWCVPVAQSKAALEVSAATCLGRRGHDGKTDLSDRQTWGCPLGASQGFRVQRLGQVSLYLPLLPRLCLSPESREAGPGLWSRRGDLIRVQKPDTKLLRRDWDKNLGDVCAERAGWNWDPLLLLSALVALRNLSLPSLLLSVPRGSGGRQKGHSSGSFWEHRLAEQAHAGGTPRAQGRGVPGLGGLLPTR